MRPAKHAALGDRSQEILGLEVTRFQAPWGEVPVVAVTEAEAITLFWWSGAAGAWKNRQLVHEPLAAPPGTLATENTWNWSRRVGLAAGAGKVCLVSKRMLTTDAEAGRSPLYLDVFEPADGEELQPTTHMEVPLDPAQIAPPGGPHPPGPHPPGPHPPGPHPGTPPANRTLPGFSLWAGIDEKEARILIVTQVYSSDAPGGDPSSLQLVTGDLNALDQTFSWKQQSLDEGGYDLDARLSGEKLLLAYRRTAHAVEVQVPPPGRPGSGPLDVLITSGPEADAHYAPLTLAAIDLGQSAAPVFTVLPGGEHPDIQSVDPPFITADRHHSTRVRFAATSPLLALPAHQTATWTPGGIDKMALIVRPDGLHRGILTGFPAGAFPRNIAPLAPGLEAFRRQDGFLRQRSALEIWPFRMLRLFTARKDAFADFLQHEAGLGLVRRRFALAFGPGTVGVASTGFEVWDLGHAQIDDPTLLTPAGDPENTQFAPFYTLAVPPAAGVRETGGSLDNTIGGVLRVEAGPRPWTFFSYTDLGDGGCRVVFDHDLAAPREIPGAAAPKLLSPRMVPGPGSADETWIELDAADWIDSGLPGYRVGLLDETSLSSQAQALVDALLTVADELDTEHRDGFTLDDGLDAQELAMVQAAIPHDATPADPVSSDPAAPPVVSFTMTPGEAQAAVAVSFDAAIEPPADGSDAVDPDTVQFAWTVFRTPTGLQLSPPLPLQVFIGPHAEITFPFSASWTVTLIAGFPDGRTRRVSAAIDVAPSLEELLWGMHDSFGKSRYHRVGDATLTLLKYTIEFRTNDEGDRARILLTENFLSQGTQMKFFPGDGLEQGTIDYRLRFGFDSTDIHLTGALALAAQVDHIGLTFFYRRHFTPGVLMRDERRFSPLTGRIADSDMCNRSDRPRVASALAAKPAGDSAVDVGTIDVAAGLTPGITIVGILVPALALLGAGWLAALLLGLAGLGAVAVAAGLAGVAAAIAAAAALTWLLVFVVPGVIRSAIVTAITDAINSKDVHDSLDNANLLRYSGEGLSEAVARQVLARAVEQGLAVDPPALGDQEGIDRFRRIFQMIVVTAGKCRVLIRPS